MADLVTEQPVWFDKWLLEAFQIIISVLKKISSIFLLTNKQFSPRMVTVNEGTQLHLYIQINPLNFGGDAFLYSTRKSNITILFINVVNTFINKTNFNMVIATFLESYPDYGSVCYAHIIQRLKINYNILCDCFFIMNTFTSL